MLLHACQLALSDRHLHSAQSLMLLAQSAAGVQKVIGSLR